MEKYTRTAINFQQKVALLEFIKVRYVESKLFDNQFAELASKELGFPVNQGQVMRTRHAFSIPANKPRRLPEPSTGRNPLVERVALLERQLNELLSALGYKS